MDSWDDFVAVVDGPDSLQACLRDLKTAAFVSLALKGRMLSRHGAISVLSIRAGGNMYLVDVHLLQVAAFTTSAGGVSLKGILESTSVKKAVYDVRNAANALFFLFDVRLRNVVEVQVYHLVSRSPNQRKFWWSLDKAIAHSGVLDSHTLADFKDARTTFAQEYVTARGGDEYLLEQRPFSNSLIAYCALDVFFLGQLYDVCRALVTSEWIDRVQQLTAVRLAESMQWSYTPWSEDKKFAPMQWQLDDRSCPRLVAGRKTSTVSASRAGNRQRPAERASAQS